MSCINIINSWIYHIDQCKFIEAVTQMKLTLLIDHEHDQLKREWFIKLTYAVVHTFIDDHKKVWKPAHANALEKLGERVTSVGFYLNFHDQNVQKLFDLANALRLQADDEPEPEADAEIEFATEPYSYFLGNPWKINNDSLSGYNQEFAKRPLSRSKEKTILEVLQSGAFRNCSNFSS